MTKTGNIATGTPAGTVIVTSSFGITVGMWFVAYVSHLPGVPVPGWLALLAMTLCLAGGGYTAGRYSSRPVLHGSMAGMASAVLNLLIVGSLIGGGGGRPAMWAAPVLFAVSALLGGIGGYAGRNSGVESAPGEYEWTAALSKILVAAVFMMITIGGLVTSYGAGLSVVDWPRTFGYNMFLYPLSRMTGGIYFEHTHRLFGTLVGLTAVALTVQVHRNDTRAGLKRFMLLVLGMIVFQGILGGLRVTGHFTLSDSAATMSPSITLAAIHGITGQCLFAAVTAIAVLASALWHSSEDVLQVESPLTDRYLNIACIIMLLVQIGLGAILRHVGNGMLIHVTAAVIAVMLSAACGARAWGLYGDSPILRKAGASVVFIAAGQFFLGIGALFTTGAFAEQQNTFLLEVIFTTAHQALGAVLLASVVLLSLLNFRLLGEGGKNPA